VLITARVAASRAAVRAVGIMLLATIMVVVVATGSNSNSNHCSSHTAVDAQKDEKLVLSLEPNFETERGKEGSMSAVGLGLILRLRDITIGVLARGRKVGGGGNGIGEHGGPKVEREVGTYIP
jgi:hypothetical protein